MSAATASSRRSSSPASSVVDVEARRRRADQAAAEAVAAEQGGHVQHVAADPAAVGSGGQEADVAGQRAEIADVVGHPLQLQGDAAEDLGPGGHAAAGERLDGPAVGRGMADRRVAGQRLDVVDACAGPARRPARARRRGAGSPARSPGDSTVSP